MKKRTFVKIFWEKGTPTLISLRVGLEGLLSKMAEFGHLVKKYHFLKYFCKMTDFINFKLTFVNLSV